MGETNSTLCFMEEKPSEGARNDPLKGVPAFSSKAGGRQGDGLWLAGESGQLAWPLLGFKELTFSLWTSVSPWVKDKGLFI